ncbi:RICIN domain-containing protein [Actinoplanes sp. NPDC049118]|uniref:RICIN domain-containing protein n=1 Tax=Actinoplanes sp. NPDC049118 TaxID=3155769 RepID=UPI0033DBEA25
MHERLGEGMRFARRPGPGHSDITDRGSMPMAMLVTTVVMSLGAVMVPVLVRQADNTTTVSVRSSAIEASQTGMDAAVGQIRAAAGDFKKLPPCELDGGTDDRYHVSIKYYAPVAGVTADLGCPPTGIPATARLTVTGTGSSAPGGDNTRTLEATYTFKTTNENINGGNIRLDQPTSPYLCMDSGGTRRPAAGTPVKVEECERKLDGDGKLVYTITSDQRFAYTPDLNIKLVKSESSTAPDGMCLDAPMPRNANNAVTFQPCLGRVARQQWSLDNSSNFRSTSDGVNLDSYCLTLKDADAGKAGSAIVIGGCGGGSNQRVWRPQAAVGAGMASSATGQLINYKQFSRCLDVTNHDVNMSYMIVWFCKQAPNGDVSWNQRWTLPPLAIAQATPVAERIRTTGTSSPGVCLRSPRSTASNKYVTVTSCPDKPALPGEDPNLAADLRWKMYGDTGVYATSYTVVDVDGRCLTPTDLTVSSPDTHPDGTAKTRVATCDGSLLQKWNAPANLTNPDPLTNTIEK